MDALAITDLTVARGGVPLLHNVNLAVAAGQAVALSGPNGLGKTTLLRTVAGLQPALSGQGLPDPEIVAYAAHSDGVKATLSVEENLRFWARVYRGRDVEDAIRAFDLGGLRDRLGGTLSAGQKRRCGLARLVLSGRPLWLLDEPTVSLDGTAQGMLADAVAGHLSEGGMAILTSHVPLPMETARLDLTPFKATAQAATLEAFGEALE